jgi:hypothetical protein
LRRCDTRWAGANLQSKTTRLGPKFKAGLFAIDAQARPHIASAINKSKLFGVNRLCHVFLTG